MKYWKAKSELLETKNKRSNKKIRKKIKKLKSRVFYWNKKYQVEKTFSIESYHDFDTIWWIVESHRDILSKWKKLRY